LSVLLADYSLVLTIVLFLVDMHRTTVSLANQNSVVKRQEKCLHAYYTPSAFLITSNKEV